MFKKQLSILFIIFWLQNSSCFIGFLFEIVEEGMDIARFLNDIISTKDTVSDISLILSNTDENQEILDSLNGINKKLDDLTSNTIDRLDNIEKLIEKLPDKIVRRLGEIASKKFVNNINSKWNKLRSLVKFQGTELMFHDLANEIRDYTKEGLVNFRDQIVSSSDGLFALIAKHVDGERDTLCTKGDTTTSHHILVNLFQTVIVTEIRTHVLLCFANIIRYPEKNGWKGNVNLLKTELGEQIKIYINVFFRSLKTAGLPYLRACDPTDWKRNDNFYAFDGFLQQTIYSLDSIDFEGFGGTTCQQNGRVHNEGPINRMRPLNWHTTCQGVIDRCHALYTRWGYGAYVCLWNNGPYRIRSMEHYGKKQGTDISSPCPEWDYRWKSWFWNSELHTFCSCQCTTEKFKFYVQMARSRVKENYVIVGMRIQRAWDYFYIQIAEGKLNATGYIPEALWVPPTRRIDGEESVHPDNILVKFNDSIFFDDVQLRPGHVLTGVQFAPVQRDGTKGFTIRVLGTKVDYETGKLDLSGEDDPWPRNLRANNILGYSANDPIKKKPHKPILPNSKGFTHILIRQTLLEDDYGQTTLPFFDGVPILNSPLSPIGGVGLFHKSYDRDHGGFISLRIYPINYTYVMDTFLQTYNFSSLTTLVP